MKPTEIQTEFLCFREQCIWLKCCYNTYSALYESDERTTKVLEASASLFFQDLNKIIIDYILLQISKITDPAESMGHKNLTFESVNASLKKENLMTKEIENLSNGLSRYRELVIDSRNKLISHLDSKTVINNLIIGEHSENEVNDFFKCLQSYSDAVGNSVQVGPLDFQATAGRGDVLDLIKLMRGKEVGE
jgi:hypothetical protein